MGSIYPVYQSRGRWPRGTVERTKVSVTRAMNIEFKFGEKAQIILTPTSKRDEQMLSLFVGESKSARISAPASSPESVIFESDGKGE